MKYPIGIQDFEKIIQDGYVYVDKTDLIHKLVNGGNIYLVSNCLNFIGLDSKFQIIKN